MGHTQITDTSSNADVRKALQELQAVVFSNPSPTPQLPQMARYTATPQLEYNASKQMYAYTDENDLTTFYTEAQLPQKLRDMLNDTNGTTA